MPTFREFLRVAELALKDKTSGKRMKEIRGILKKHDAFKGITPEKATAILEDLGPTFVKMGQIASNRADILPKEYCDAFESLRTNVPALPFNTVIEIIERAYGKSWNEVFSSIDENPLGSASIAQVHKATLHDGSIIAVKVRRPGIVPKMAEDIMLMKHMLAWAEFSTTTHDGVVLSLDNLVTELERTTAEEVDFSVELNNLVRFRNEIEDQSGISSPLPYPLESTEEVLVMEFVTGIMIDEKDKLIKQGVNLDNIGRRLAQSYVAQVIDGGFFHADPHPGNIVVCNDTIVWIDLGMVGSLTLSERALVGKVFAAIATHDSYELKESLLALVEEKGKVDHGRLIEQMDSLLASYASSDLSEINIGTAFMDVIEILRSQNLMMPPPFTMLARGFLTIEGVLADIAPKINVVDIVSKQVQKQMRNPEYLFGKSKEVFLNSLHSLESASKIPSQLSNSLEMLERGELKFNADMKIADDAIASLYTVAGRLALALISAGLFVGSSVLCTTQLQPMLLGVPLLGFLGYLGAFILGVYVIWETLVSRHKQINKMKVE